MIPEVKHLAAGGVKEPEKWIKAIQATCERFQINTPKQIAAFIAQTAHESGGYTMLQENLNYRATTMATVWPNRFAELGPDKKPKKDEKGKNIPTKVALALEKHPEQLANMVYGGRMGNGPVQSGEGWKYRGRGLKQLTGKDNYTRCGQAIGLDIVENPDLLLEPEAACLSAGWFWSVNKLAPFAEADDIAGMTKKINGGLIGLEDRTKRYKAVLATIQGA